MIGASVTFVVPARADPPEPTENTRQDDAPPRPADAPPRPAPEAGRSNEPDSTVDVVTLRDGRRIRGRIVVKEPGHWVVIETEDGRRRTLPWDRVEEVDLAARTVETTVPDAAARAWTNRAGGGLGYELRGMMTGIVLPAKTFGLRGRCATGSGYAPAEIYGHTTEDRARGVGGGVGGRASYMYTSMLDPKKRSTWWGLRVGLGLDLSFVYTDTPVGIPRVDGELCSTIASRPHTVEHEPHPLAVAAIPLHLGGHIGLGNFDQWAWRGLVLGVAWVPTSFHVGVLTEGGTTHFNYLGLELTLDFTTLSAKTAKDRPEAHTRIAVFFSPPANPSQPTAANVGVGAVWY